MSEGPKWTLNFSIESAWNWLPHSKWDDESNLVIVGFDWFCFTLIGSWRKA